MATATITIELDADLAREFEELCSETGMSMDEAIMVFIRESIRQKRFPFDLDAEIPNAETVAAIKETELSLAGRLPCKTYANVDDLMKELLTDG